MMEWLNENKGNIIVIAILVVIVALAIINMIKNKKKGKLPCGCDYGSCASSCMCNSKKEE